MSYHFRPLPQPAADPACDRAELRAELCAIIDRAIALLDAMDGDSDLEPILGEIMRGHVDEAETNGGFFDNPDDEPSLGWTKVGAVSVYENWHGYIDSEAGDDNGLGDREGLDEQLRGEGRGRVLGGAGA